MKRFGYLNKSKLLVLKIIMAVAYEPLTYSTSSFVERRWFISMAWTSLEVKTFKIRTCFPCIDGLMIPSSKKSSAQIRIDRAIVGLYFALHTVLELALIREFVFVTSRTSFDVDENRPVVSRTMWSKLFALLPFFLGIARRQLIFRASRDVFCWLPSTVLQCVFAYLFPAFFLPPVPNSNFTMKIAVWYAPVVIFECKVLLAFWHFWLVFLAFWAFLAFLALLA